MTHATSDDLLQYLDHTHPRSEEIALHLQSCAACTAQLEDLRSFTRRLGQPGVWEKPNVAPLPTFVEELANLEARLTSEESSAERLLPWLRNATDTTAIPEEWRNAGAVRTLLRIVTAERDDQPGPTLGLARLARRIAEGIDETHYPAPFVVQLRGQTWKEEANLLRHTGEYTMALQALDQATACFAAHPTGVYDAALVDLVRGMTLTPMGRPSEAIALLRSAASVLQSYGDDRRYRYARLAEAYCHFDMGQYDEAREIVSGIIPDTRTANDQETLARLIANVANCDTELGNLERAAIGYQDAIARYKTLGMTSEIVRARWGLARVYLHRGEWEQALATLYAINAEFTSLGMHGEAGLVVLDVVETLLAMGRDEDVPAILPDLIATLTKSGATTAAMTALSYLRDAAQAGRLERRDIVDVRSFLSRPHDPGQAFTPLH